MATQEICAIYLGCFQHHNFYCEIPLEVLFQNPNLIESNVFCMNKHSFSKHFFTLFYENALSDTYKLDVK